VWVERGEGEFEFEFGAWVSMGYGADVV
jgi:hypothetical protein